ncbi:MAG: hypothetical protein MEQ84_03385 [Mesorhizobium sp.]|nr:hypothetical protein [Mesorhizobium sp.]
MREIRLRLSWRATWADRDSDFVANAPGYEGTVGRICQKAGGTGIDWEWSFHAQGAEITNPGGMTRGSEPTPRLAAKRVEDAWHAAIKGTSRDFMPVHVHAAARQGANR